MHTRKSVERDGADSRLVGTSDRSRVVKHIAISHKCTLPTKTIGSRRKKAERQTHSVQITKMLREKGTSKENSMSTCFMRKRKGSLHGLMLPRNQGSKSRLTSNTASQDLLADHGDGLRTSGLKVGSRKRSSMESDEEQSTSNKGCIGEPGIAECVKDNDADDGECRDEDTGIAETMPRGNDPPLDYFPTRLDELSSKVEQLEKRVNDVKQFYLTVSHTGGRFEGLGKDKNATSMKKLHQDASRREAAAAKRMQELMRQFGSILRQITQHKWAWPFMQPVDVEGLGLHDYYQIIDRPMDFSTIKNQMEAKDGTGYKHVNDICSDVALVFRNAMKYNEEKSEVYVMAKTLLEKLEEKWLQFLPKVREEEKRQEEAETEALLKMQLAREAAHAKFARDLHDELCNVDACLEELRETVVKRCRCISTVEKRKLGFSISRLQPEDLTRALQMVAQSNPNINATAEEVEIYINAQSESVLWRLKFLVDDALGNRTEV